MSNILHDLTHSTSCSIVSMTQFLGNIMLDKHFKNELESNESILGSILQLNFALDWNLITKIMLGKLKGAAASAITTRSVSDHYLVGSNLEKLPQVSLPTALSLARRRNYLFEESKNTPTSHVSGTKKAEIYNKLANETIDIWLLASKKFQPVLRSQLHIYDQLRDILDTFFEYAVRNKGYLMKNPKKLEEKKNELNFVVVITMCQCFTNKDPTYFDLQNCTCQQNMKIPQEEFQFFTDQLLQRKDGLFIGGKDTKAHLAIKAEEEKKARRIQRQLEEEERRKKQRERESSSSQKVPLSKGFKFGSDDSSDTSSEEEPESQPERMRAPRCNWDYSNATSFALRHDMGDRVLSGMINSVLMDLTIYDQTKFVSPFYAQSMKSKLGQSLAEEHAKNVGHVFIGFDGKKNKNLEAHSKGTVYENVTVVTQPDAKYLHHFSLSSGTGRNIGRELFQVILTYEMYDTLLGIGADSTSVNTSPSVGAIRYLEMAIERPLQHVIW